MADVASRIWRIVQHRFVHIEDDGRGQFPKIAGLLGNRRPAGVAQRQGQLIHGGMVNYGGYGMILRRSLHPQRALQRFMVMVFRTAGFATVSQQRRQEQGRTKQEDNKPIGDFHKLDPLKNFQAGALFLLRESQEEELCNDEAPIWHKLKREF